MTSITLLVLILCGHIPQEHTVNAYLTGIVVGKPVEYKNLKLFPLLAHKTLNRETYLTMDEALAQGMLTIREVGTGDVNAVEVKNRSAHMVFIMTGEVISGAKQDRMVQDDVLIRPKSEWIQIPVYCVEHGRWTARSPEFMSEKLLVPSALRQTAKITHSQQEVWEEIAASQDRMNVASGTGTVRATYQDEHVRSTIAEYEKKLEHVPAISSSTIGVVATTGTRIICVDLFANNSLLKKLWPKLLKSYAMDALVGEEGTVDAHAVEQLIEMLKQATYETLTTQGCGTLMSITADWGKGSVLVYKANVIHLDCFRSTCEDELHLDFRREQRNSRE